MNELKLTILNILKTLEICIPNSTETQWVVRCPYCGDSRKSFDHGHLSIKIDIHDKFEPIIYNCFRCGESGLFTNDTMEDLSLGYHGELKHEITSSILKANKVVKRFNLKELKLKIPEFKDTALNRMKLFYINNRLNTNITLSNCSKYKVILDIYEFLDFNNIENHEDINKIGSTLKTDYIGFLASNNNQIIFRSVFKDNKLGRYIKRFIDPNNISMNTFYSIPSPIDLLTTKNIDIHIAEGTFDIISIYHKINKTDNNMYFASCGFSYTKILRYLIYMGFMTNSTIYIYADNDKSDYEIEKLLKSDIYNVWVDNIHIVRNMVYGEKDFGIAYDKLNLQSRKIK